MSIGRSVRALVLSGAMMWVLIGEGYAGEGSGPAGLPLPAQERGEASAEVLSAWNAYLDGEVDRAAQTFRTALEADPHSALAHFGLETVLAGRARYREALDHALAAARDGRDSVWLEVYLADVLALLEFAESPDPALSLLGDLSEDKDLDPRGRAAVHVARARALESCGRTDAAVAAWGELPFVRRWLVLGAFSNRERGGFGRDHGPEADLPRLDRDKTYQGRTGPVVWREAPRCPASGYLDLAALLYPHEENVAYAATYLVCEQATEVDLALGAAGACALWVNGEPLVDSDLYHLGHHPLQRVYRVRLDPGPNQVVVKSAGGRDARCGISLLVLADRDARWRVDPAAERAPHIRPNPQPATGRSGLDWGLAGFLAEVDADAAGHAMAQNTRAYLLLDRMADDARFQRTRPRIERAAQARPACPLFLEMAAVVQHDDNAARAYLDRAAQVSDHELAAQELLAARWRDGGFYRKAEAVARRVLASRDSAEAHEVLADVVAERGWDAQAHAHDRAARDAAPGRARLYARVADRAPGRAARLEALRAGVARTGDHELRRRLTRELLTGGPEDAQRAADLVRANLDADPWPLADHLLARDAALARGDVAGAVQVLEAALDRLPGEPALLEAYGAARLLQGDAAGAVRAWRNALEVAPDNPDLRGRIAQIEPQAAPFYAPWSVSLDELVQTKPDPADYPRHNVAVLFDQGVVRVHPNGAADHMIHLVRMALRPGGARQLEQYGMGYDPDRERIEVLSARVVQPDGSVHRATDVRDHTVERGGGDQGRVYARYHVKRVHLPQVRAGSIVEIRLLKEASGPNPFGDDFEDAFYLGSESPTLRFQYVLDTPEDLDVAVRTFRAEEVRVRRTEEVSGGRRVQRWEGTDLPGMEMEPGMPPFTEVAPSLRASTFASWAEVARWYWRVSRESLDLPENIAARARELVADARTDREKLARIYYHVVDRVRYVGIELGRSGYEPHAAERTWRTQYGDCKDTAVLFCALLEAVGVDARVALVRTWSQGREPTGLPGAQRFNHAICYVPDVAGRDWWLDGTTDYHHVLELPSMDQGGTALVTGPEGGMYTYLPEDPGTANREEIFATVVLQPDGSAEVAVRVSYAGAFAPAYRSRLVAPERWRQTLTEFLPSRFPGAEVTGFSATGGDLRDKQVAYTFRMQVPGLAVDAGDGARKVDPWLLPERMSRLAGMTERTHDLLLGLRRSRYVDTTVLLPAGAQVRSVPAPIDRDRPFGLVRRTVRQGPGRVTVALETRVRSRRVTAEQYPDFRAFCHAVDAAQEDWIVYEPAGEE